MKILLIGEYSGVHKNLKEGLVELGHEVVTASSGDGWKKIEADINWSSSRKGKIGKIDSFLHLLLNSNKFYGFDVAQFIAPFIFSRSLVSIDKYLAGKIFKKNNKNFLIGAGCNESITKDFLEKKFKYPQLFNEINKSVNGHFSVQSLKKRKYSSFFFKNINGYIPLMYEYAQGFRDVGHQKLCPTIPIPMNINKIKYIENTTKEKVIFFHGLTREGPKGTPVIRQAMENIKKKYPNDVDIIIDGGMPLNDYISLLSKVNVVIDQAYSVSYGVNAVYNMAMGKIVVGGGEKECLQEFHITDCPIISIQPNVSDIEKKLVSVLENKKDISRIGYLSRKYVEDVHDFIKIAQKYVEVWHKS